ncbi:hypothetical protein LTS18_010476 [Coniosporium uncinatum]|uniref:Uncharacterized protein n=1 Tax=Coniosporium uncinatum TaxID=93489 RepID=A0ACC3D9M2_9PEZI|nr:hypothetical protein LTS18_010476 [Coniosporium uncinatum]
MRVVTPDPATVERALDADQGARPGDDVQGLRRCREVVFARPRCGRGEDDGAADGRRRVHGSCGSCGSGCGAGRAGQVAPTGERRKRPDEGSGEEAGADRAPRGLDRVRRRKFDDDARKAIITRNETRSAGTDRAGLVHFSTVSSGLGLFEKMSFERPLVEIGKIGEW